MTSPDTTQARSPGKRHVGVRVALVAGCLLLAGLSLSQTAAQVLMRSNAQLAHVLDPANGRVTARLSEQMLAIELLGGASSQAAELAVTALRQDPTAAEAVSTLALQQQIRGDTRGSDRLFAYGNRLSRRELRPQLWAIEEAVSRGDIEGALHHYDVALRTSGGAQDLLFPILENALREPVVRRALLETLSTRPVWTRAFINYAAVNISEPASTVAFMEAGERSKLPIQEAERTAVVNAIAGRGMNDLAWRYYASFRPGARRERSRDATFGGTADNPAVFDWVPRNEFGAIASIQSGDQGGVLDYYAPSTGGGVLVEQLQLLPPGTYRLSGMAGPIEAADGGAPYWTLSCQSGSELGRASVPLTQTEGASFSANVQVPANCPVQKLSLVVPSSDQIAGSSGQFQRVELAPVGRVNQ